MNDMLDKNGNLLKGGAVWLRTISRDGGLAEHDKKVAIDAFSNFLEYRPDLAEAIANQDFEKRRKSFKLIK